MMTTSRSVFPIPPRPGTESLQQRYHVIPHCPNGTGCMCTPFYDCAAPIEAKDPRWSHFDTLMSYLGFCCMVVIATSLAFIALCYATAAYPEVTCLALQVVGICK